MTKGRPCSAAGSAVVGPGGRDRPGYFYRPTVLTGIKPGMRVATEEVFGPVALLFVVDDADEALAVANGTEFGLGSSVWTRDAEERRAFRRGTRRRARCSSTGWWSRCRSCPSAV